MSSRGSSCLLQLLSQLLQLLGHVVPLTLSFESPRPLCLQRLLQLLDASLPEQSKHAEGAAMRRKISISIVWFSGQPEAPSSSSEAEQPHSARPPFWLEADPTQSLFFRRVIKSERRMSVFDPTLESSGAFGPSSSKDSAGYKDLCVIGHSGIE